MLQDSTTPYRHTRHGDCHILLASIAGDAVENALLSDAAGSPLPGGRGAARLVEVSGAKLVIRHYRRGGAMRWLGGRYLANRPKAEFEVLQFAVEHGLPVPPPLGALWRRQGIFYSGALATAWVEGEDLDAWLRAHAADGPACDDTMRACGAVIRRMHDAGIYHADLQVKNIRITPAGPVLLDFDNATVSMAVPDLHRARNLLRFRRSLEKNRLHGHYFDSLCAGYGAIKLPRWLQTLYSIKGRLSDRSAGG